MPPSQIAKNLPTRVRSIRPGMSSKHLTMVCMLPSVLSGVTGQTVPHHLLRTGEHGMGRKSSDRWAIPLTSREHDALHRDGNEDQFLAAFGIDGRALAKALWAASGDLEAMRGVVFRVRQIAALKLRAAGGAR